MQSVEIGAVRPADQTQSAFDLFLIFVGANIVATTFQVGASIASSFSFAGAAAVIALGSVVGALLVAVLAPLGSRLRVPSVIACRAALGLRGASLVAAVLYISNFVWIALNNVIAASACARIAGGPDAAWAVAFGILATVVVASGPRAVAGADRVAVPAMLVTCVALTVVSLRGSATPAPAQAAGLSWSRGLDVVVGYQVSWILMFADYSRYTRSGRASGGAVFLALALTSIWMMPLGTYAARAAGSEDPGAMLAAVGLGAGGALLLTLATITTNFVNIYMSALAWKSLLPHTPDAAVVWSIGGIGAILSAVPGVWLEQYARFVIVLGGVLVPIGGLLIAHYYGVGARRLATPEGVDAFVADLYDARGPFAGVSVAGVSAWAAGGLAFFAAGRIGGTLPALAVSMVVYLVIERMRRR